MAHLVASISGHGFGHVAQTAPVLNALHRSMPGLQITVRSTAPAALLRDRIVAPFAHLQSEGDIGMIMSSALAVRVPESLAAYRRFHDGWASRVVSESLLLRALNADFVFSNAGYLPLAGAQHAGIANAALCSLNWYDIYRHYGGEPWISEQIHDCYACSKAFLRATPGMAMEYLPNVVPVLPIARVGRNMRDVIDRKLKLPRDHKLVLVSMGGIASRLPIERWPRISGVTWLVQKDWQVAHPDAIILESLQLDFSDLLASCDLLVCKPGYGSFVEAASSGVPVIYVSRADWPESAALIAWLEEYGVCRQISPGDMQTGNFGALLEQIWNSSQPGPVIPAGATQVAHWLAEQLQ
ncbi:MAG: hypothetical protein WA632_01185 [Gallionella sp.]